MAVGIQTSTLPEKKPNELSGRKAFIPVVVLDNDYKGAVKIPLDSIAYDDTEIKQEIRQEITENTRIINTLLDTEVQIDTQISGNESTVYLETNFKHLNTGAESSDIIPLPVASEVQAGVMNTATFNALRNVISEVENIIGASWLVMAKLGENPSADAVNGAWVSQTGQLPRDGNTVVNLDNNNELWKYGNYEGINQWVLTASSFNLTAFTNNMLGGIKGSLQKYQVFAEADGTGTVNGLDLLESAVDTNTKNIGSKQDKFTGDYMKMVRGDGTLSQGFIEVKTELDGVYSDLPQFPSTDSTKINIKTARYIIFLSEDKLKATLLASCIVCGNNDITASETFILTTGRNNTNGNFLASNWRNFNNVKSAETAETADHANSAYNGVNSVSGTGTNTITLNRTYGNLSFTVNNVANATNATNATNVTATTSTSVTAANSTTWSNARLTKQSKMCAFQAQFTRSVSTSSGVRIQIGTIPGEYCPVNNTAISIYRNSGSSAALASGWQEAESLQVAVLTSGAIMLYNKGGGSYSGNVYYVGGCWGLS